MGKSLIAIPPAQAPTQGMRPLESLEYIRVTSMKLFEQCPAQWAAKYLAEGFEDEEQSPAAAIGTAVHNICEDMLLALHQPGYERVDTDPFWAVVPEHEQPAVLKYIENLTLLPVKQALAVEERWYYHMRDDAPLISGMWDFVYEATDGALVVQDHKTNRSFNGKDWWAAEIQPQFYAWAARKEWPEYDRVRFRIGYPNLARSVEWETSPEDDGHLQNRFNRIWRQMKECQDTNKWPQQLNDFCGYCPLQRGCPEHNGAISNFRDSMLAKVGNASVVEKLQHARTLKKVIEAYCGQLEAEVRELVGGEGRELRGGDLVATLETGARRELPFQLAWQRLMEVCSSHPTDAGLGEAVWEAANDVFGVRIGALEYLAQQHPEFQAVVESAVRVDNASPTLKITEARRLKK